MSGVASVVVASSFSFSLAFDGFSGETKAILDSNPLRFIFPPKISVSPDKGVCGGFCVAMDIADSDNPNAVSPPELGTESIVAPGIDPSPNGNPAPETLESILSTKRPRPYAHAHPAPAPNAASSLTQPTYTPSKAGSKTKEWTDATVICRSRHRAASRCALSCA